MLMAMSREKNYMKNDYFFYIIAALFITVGCVWSFVFNKGEIIASISIGFFLMGIGIVSEIRCLKNEFLRAIEEIKKPTHKQE